MYGLRTDVHFLQGFWDSSAFRYFVGANYLSVIVVVVWVDHSLLCVTVGGLWRTWLVVTVLLVSLCSFIYLGVTIFCLCVSVYFSVTNGFIPFRLPLVDALSVSFPGGRREVFFFGAWLVTSPIFATGFSALIQISLTDTALALTCKS
jgi:hypothetical protein